MSCHSEYVWKLAVIEVRLIFLCFLGRGGGRGLARGRLINHSILPLPHPAVSSLQGKRLPWPLIVEFPLLFIKFVNRSHLLHFLVSFLFVLVCYFGFGFVLVISTQNLIAWTRGKNHDNNIDKKHNRCADDNSAHLRIPNCCSTEVRELAAWDVLLLLLPHTNTHKREGKPIWFCHLKCLW